MRSEMTGQSTVILVCSSRPYLGPRPDLAGPRRAREVPGGRWVDGGGRLVCAGGAITLADVERERGRQTRAAIRSRLLDELAAGQSGGRKPAGLPAVPLRRALAHLGHGRARRVLRAVAVDDEGRHGAGDPGRRGVRLAAQHGSGRERRLHGVGPGLRGRRRAEQPVEPDQGGRAGQARAPAAGGGRARPWATS